ncbi:hypothetical protein ACL9RI_03925 [Janthinobacterium sp. Mn2066]|uniref:hypothetical protein n=1 Tax=Janthinobacterium sp. Mn2066 TaxID=3395264 RepID=UPI003BDD7EC4
MRTALLLACMLAGCAARAPLPEMLPLAVPCISSRPAAPSLPVVPSMGIYPQVQALLARDKLRAAYEQELEALVDACAGGSS